MRKIIKPAPGEYAEYAIMYISLLPDDGNILSHLKENGETLKQLFHSIPDEKLNFRYEANKWSIKEILQHIIDDERIYTYRALRFARADNTNLPGFDQEPYAEYSKADERTISDLLEEYRVVRLATISLFEYMPEDAFLRGGIASNHYVTVRALLFHIAGHELHHLNILKERYLS